MAEKAATPPPKPALQQTLMYMMFFMALFVMFEGSLRDALGGAVGVVFTPLIGFGGAYPLLTLLFAGLFTMFISSFSRHLVTDWVKTARVQKKSTALQKAQMDAMRRGNQAKVAKLQDHRKQMSQESMEITTQGFKPLMYTLLPFIVFWAWLNKFYYVDVFGQGHLYIALPWGFQTSLLSGYIVPLWFGMYFMETFLLGNFFTRLFKFLTFRTKLAALTAQGEAG